MRIFAVGSEIERQRNTAREGRGFAPLHSGYELTRCLAAEIVKLHQHIIVLNGQHNLVDVLAHVGEAVQELNP
jgi:hypothetical protein